jgi:hypothetical protein
MDKHTVINYLENSTNATEYLLDVINKYIKLGIVVLSPKEEKYIQYIRVQHLNRNLAVNNLKED